MTPEQRTQWNLYACVPRCIIKLAEIRGIPISDIDFAARFESRFPEWKNRFGLTDLPGALQVAFDLQLATKWARMANCTEMQNHVKNNGFASSLVLTHKFRSEETGELQELHHCRLLLGFSGSDFVLFNPNQDGQAFPMIETGASLTEQKAEFIVLL